MSHFFFSYVCLLSFLPRTASGWRLNPINHPLQRRIPDSGPGESSRQWIPFLLVGGGYSQPIGPRTWLNLQVLFDVLQHERSPYSRWSPIFSVGVGVGF